MGAAVSRPSQGIAAAHCQELRQIDFGFPSLETTTPRLSPRWQRPTTEETTLVSSFLRAIGDAAWFLASIVALEVLDACQLSPILPVWVLSI